MSTSWMFIWAERYQIHINRTISKQRRFFLNGSVRKFFVVGHLWHTVYTTLNRWHMLWMHPTVIQDKDLCITRVCSNKISTKFSFLIKIHKLCWNVLNWKKSFPRISSKLNHKYYYLRWISLKRKKKLFHALTLVKSPLCSGYHASTLPWGNDVHRIDIDLRLPLYQILWKSNKKQKSFHFRQPLNHLTKFYGNRRISK